MKIPYKCKFCGQPGDVEYQPVKGIEVQVEKWIEQISCPRCYAFNIARVKITDRIIASCRTLQVARQGHDRELDAIEKNIRIRLINRTKEFSELICGFHMKGVVWEPDFVDMLMNQPDDPHKALNYYRKNVARL